MNYHPSGQLHEISSLTSTLRSSRWMVGFATNGSVTSRCCCPTPGGVDGLRVGCLLS